jgi:NifU-like protein
MDSVKEHFINARNVGELENADGAGESGSLGFGDAVRITLRLDAEARIKEAKFKAFGGARLIASCSALTEIIQKMDLEQAEQVTTDHVAEYLGIPPQERIGFPALGREALSAAITNFRTRQMKKQESEIVCHCFGTAGTDIERLIRKNDLRTVQQVTYYSKAGGGCGECHPKIEATLQARDREQKADYSLRPTKKSLTNIQKFKLIEETLKTQIIPGLKADRGDLELIDIQDNKVYVALRGSCSFCHSSSLTIKHYVEAKLKEFVWDEIVVEEIRP